LIRIALDSDDPSGPPDAPAEHPRQLPQPRADIEDSLALSQIDRAQGSRVEQRIQAR
jgi:hypothetical protein